MSRLNRRRFLATSAIGAKFVVAGTRASGRVLGANEVIRVGVVGLRGRGQLHQAMVSSLPGSRLTALCDVDPAILGRSVERAGKDGPAVLGFEDLRELIACEDVDAVTIATPNHWHSLAAIWACQAEKDVYVEKPISHNVFEGRQLVNAARKYGRMVQAGTQARSNPDVIEAVAWLRAGNLGEIDHVRGTCYKPRMPIGKGVRGEVPEGLNYDLWTGPAPLRPLARENLHYDWHWIYDYGNGDLGNQGVHEMDVARWLLGYSYLSPRVISIGGRLGYEDDGETPNTQLVYHAYDGPPLVFEVRGLPKSKEHQADARLWGRNMDTLDGFSEGRGVGVVAVCEGGKLAIVEGGAKLVAVDRAGKTIRQFHATHPEFGIGWSKGDQFHFRSWLEAVRTRDRTKLNAEILEGHLSAGLCHTGMISHRLGRNLPASRIRREVEEFPLLAERFESLRDHLVRNAVDPEQSRPTLGPWLAMDSATERFVDNPAADALLSREYREPFVVPEIEPS